MSLLRATLFGLLLAFALPLAAGSLSLHITNPTPSPWRIWASASLHLAEEGALAAPLDGAGLQVPARGSLQVRLAWEDGPGQARPLFHAESVEAADALVWTMAPDRIPGGSVQWTLRLQAPSPELLLRSVADPIFLPSPAPHPGNPLAAIPLQEPDAGSNNPGDPPSPSPQGASTETSSSGGEGPAPSRKGRPLKVYATLELEARGSSRRITLLDVVRPPVVTRVHIQAQGTPDAVEERCPWTREGGRRHLTLVPGYLYAIKVDENAFFSRDPLIAYSRVMVLSGPGGLPWNAASLVGSRERADGPGDPWRFRLRAPDTLPGFQEVDGGRRNSFVFGPVEAGGVHGVTSLPLPEQAGNAERKSVPGNDVRPQEAGGERPKSTRWRKGALAEITVRNHLGSSCYLRADGVRRMRGCGHLLDLGGNSMRGSVRWGERADRAETSLFLEVPAGQAVHLAVDRNSRWGTEKRQRVLHLEVPGGTTGATLLAVQGNHPTTSPAVPWSWFLRDTSGREAALLPGLELVGGNLLEIRSVEGPGDGSAIPVESKQPLEDEWEEVVEASGVAPLAGNGLPQDSGPGLLPAAVLPPRKPEAGSENREYANLEFETRGRSRRITLLGVTTPPTLTRMPIQAEGGPDFAEERCRWVREGERRFIQLVPGFRYFVKVKETSYFGRDPLIAYSRVMVLSGPGGTPWNAASLVGSRDGAAGPGDPWRFRLRTRDTLPGFQEEAGGRRNSFVFGEVEAGVVHGVTTLPIPPQDGNTERESAPRKRVRFPEDGEEASQTNKRKKGVLAGTTLRNHAGRTGFLRADDGSPSGSPGGGGRASTPVRKARSRPYAILKFETRGASRRITLLEVDLTPKLARRPIPEPGTTEGPEESCRWVEEGPRRHLDLVPGYLYSITITANSYFARDPLIPFSRALVLSGPGGEPWNAATLVGWSNRVAGGDAGWHFRLRDTDALPGFQEDAGGRRNHFLFGPVEAGAVHGVTSFPTRDRDDETKALPGEGKDVEDDWWVVEEEPAMVPLAGNRPEPESSPGPMELALAATSSQPAPDDGRGKRE